LDEELFIEDTFPVKEVSLESANEKTIRQGHVSAMHLWWARRPLASSRATAYCALVPASPIGEERARMKDFIARLSKWQTPPGIVERARKDILRANGGEPPKILDPFAGGGSIPLEALRLGCDAYASDYNPVATLLLKCTLVYPQRYGASRSRGAGLVSRASGDRLPEDISRLGLWVLDETRKEVGRFYPEEKEGNFPICYIWVRTIPCQNPACLAEIPLMRQYWLARRHGTRISLCPYSEGKSVRFKIVGKGYERVPKGFDPDKGTVSKAIVTCLVCGSTIDDSQTRSLFAQGRSGQRLVAVVRGTRGKSGKNYRVATHEDEVIFEDAEDSLFEKATDLSNEWGMSAVPEEQLPPAGTLGFRIQRYNMRAWGDLFNSRQKLALIVFTEMIRKAYAKLLSEGYEEEYAKAITEYLALTLDRLADQNNNLCRWRADVESPSNLFVRQAIAIVWDYAEPNIISGLTGSWQSMLKRSIEALKSIDTSTGLAEVRQCSATSLPYPDAFFDAVFTDPPYYDNVPYSHLSDFFYVWLKRAVSELEPDLFATPLTPKNDEIVAYSRVQEPYESGKQFFEYMLQKSFKEITRVLKPNGVAVIVYAHKSTAGWETLVNSLLDSGLVVTGAWPIHTEMGARLRAAESAALASSIYMVCRKINKDPTGFYREVKENLVKYLNQKLERLWTEGISGPDFFIAAIGSAIEVFGRYDKVIDDEGEVIRADRLLEDVRRIVTDYAVKQVLHDGFASEIKPLTRFYVLWRWAYNDRIVPFDDARKLGQSVGIDVSQEWNKGFISKEKEFIEVLGPEDRALESLESSSELVDVLHRVLILWKQGKYAEITSVLRDTGYGKSDVFYRVAQAISESLTDGGGEKKLLEGFLSGKERVVKEVKKETGQMRLFE
jgi:adenine-specific DNA methylase